MFFITIKLIKVCLYIMKPAIKVMFVHTYFVNCFSSEDIDVERLPAFHYSVDFIFSFWIMDFIVEL